MGAKLTVEVAWAQGDREAGAEIGRASTVIGLSRLLTKASGSAHQMMRERAAGWRPVVVGSERELRAVGCFQTEDAVWVAPDPIESAEVYTRLAACEYRDEVTGKVEEAQAWGGDADEQAFRAHVGTQIDWERGDGAECKGEVIRIEQIWGKRESDRPVARLVCRFVVRPR